MKPKRLPQPLTGITTIEKERIYLYLSHNGEIARHPQPHPNLKPFLTLKIWNRLKKGLWNCEYYLKCPYSKKKKKRRRHYCICSSGVFCCSLCRKLHICQSKKSVLVSSGSKNCVFSQRKQPQCCVHETTQRCSQTSGLGRFMRSLQMFSERTAGRRRRSSERRGEAEKRDEKRIWTRRDGRDTRRVTLQKNGNVHFSKNREAALFAASINLN